MSEELPRPPRSIPPRVVDVLAIAVAALLYLGYLIATVLPKTGGHPTLGPPEWTPRTVLAAVAFPSVFALWWRRAHPVAVLAVALIVTVFCYPIPGVFTAIALYTAGTRLSMRQAGGAWLAGSAALFVGKLGFGGSAVVSDLTSSLVSVGAPTALGMYVGARRSYLDRLKERALFARALATFLPPEVARMVESSPEAFSLDDEVEATVVFSDIRGFSGLAETLPARAVADLVGAHVAAMAEVVSAAGGTLDKFAGDAVMAVFGAPRKLEDHAERGVRCAIAMQAKQAELNEEARGTDLPTPGIGIGINTGTVIAGTLGGAGRLDYTVLGDAVNVAQRLQSEAPAGEIFASAATVGQIDGFDAEPVGYKQLKGRQELIEVFRIPWTS